MRITMLGHTPGAFAKTLPTLLRALQLRWQYPEDLNDILRSFLFQGYHFLLSRSTDETKWNLNVRRDDGFLQKFHFEGEAKNFALYVDDDSLCRACLVPQGASDTVHLRLQRFVGPDPRSDWLTLDEHLLPPIPRGSPVFEVVAMAYWPSPPAVHFLCQHLPHSIALYYDTQEEWWKPACDSPPRALTDGISMTTAFLIALNRPTCNGSTYTNMQFVGQLDGRALAQYVQFTPWRQSPFVAICDTPFDFQAKDLPRSTWVKYPFPLPIAENVLSLGYFLA